MYRRSTKGWIKHFDFILLDCLCLAIAFFLAYWLRHGFSNPLNTILYRNMFIVVLVINFLVILILGTMTDVLKRGYWKELIATLFQGLVMFLGIIVYLFTTKSATDYSRITIYLMLIIYVVITYVVRILWKKLLSIFSNGANNALLLITDDSSASTIIDTVLSNKFGRHRIIGLVEKDSSKVGQIVNGIKIVASNETVVDYVMKNWVDEVLISLDKDDFLLEDIVNDLVMMGVTVHLDITKVAGNLGAKQTVENMGGILVVSSSMNYMTSRQYIVKRAFDIFLGLIGCIFTGFLFLILAPIIKKESPGPVFFVQERIGKNGKPFMMYKFRSMYIDADEKREELLEQNRHNDNLMFKMDFDPRIIGNKVDEEGNKKTGIGAFIRKYSLDEFPQFLNVLKGEMSIVGTRPPLRSEYEKYSIHHKARLAAKPGMTGLWQVSGRSDILDFEEVVKLDTQYISSWSVGLDLKILLKTIKVVLKNEGSM